MNWAKKHRVVLIITFAILIRLALLFLDFAFDVHNHIAWGKDLAKRGFSGFYETLSSEIYGTAFPNYPPIINYVFYLLSLLYSGIVTIEWWLNTNIPIFPSKLVLFVESRTFAAGLFKLPAIFADFGLAWILYLFAQKIAPARKNLQAFVYAGVLLNPAYFYNSAFWGQIDSIPLFFALAAFYLVWYSKRLIISAVLFTCGLLIKPTILVFTPLFIVLFFVKQKSVLTIIKAGIISFAVFWIAFLPFYKAGNLLLFPFTIYDQKIMAAQSLAYVTNGAFNFWALISRFKGIKDVEPFLFGISYQHWGYVLTGACFLVLFYFLLKKKQKVEIFLYTAFFMSFSAFLFLTKMHERYTMLMLPFLLLIAVKNPKMWKWYIVMSVISFVNLSYAWQAIKIEPYLAFISHPTVTFTLSLLNIGIFAYLLFRRSRR